MSAAPLPLHFLYGNQQLLIDETCEGLQRKILGNRDPDLAYQRFDVNDLIKEGPTQSADEKIDHFCLSCETLPFLSDRKLLRLDHLEKLKAPKGKGGEASFESGSSAMTRLFHYMLGVLEKPPEVCWLLLTAVAGREQDISAPLLKVLKAQATLHKFIAYENESPLAWVIKRAEQKRLKFAPSGAELFLELVGNDLNELDQELEKLSLLLGEGALLNESVLLGNVQANKHFSVFRITQALGQKDLVPALETLDQIMLEAPKEHVRIFVLIAQHFQKLLNIRYLQNERIPEKVMIEKLGLHPFLGKQTIEQAKHFSIPELEHLLIEMSELDLKFKFQSRHAHSLFQHLFQKLCLGGYRSPA